MEIGVEWWGERRGELSGVVGLRVVRLFIFNAPAATSIVVAIVSCL